MQRAHVQRTDLDSGELVVRQRASELPDQRAFERSPAREEHADVLRLEAASGIGERGRGGFVEPLHVVDADQERLFARELANRAEHGNPDRVRIGWRPFVVLEDERAGESPLLRGRKAAEGAL